MRCLCKAGTHASSIGWECMGLQVALSQILVCRDCAASFPLPMELLRGQGVELFGRTAALLTAPCKLPFAQHVHQLNAGEGGLRGVERFEP